VIALGDDFHETARQLAFRAFAERDLAAGPEDRQRIRFAIEPAVAIWDVAAIQLIVEEAGGRFTDMRGDARIDSGSALSTNGAVHDAVLEYFR
jgi:hypothetical protein